MDQLLSMVEDVEREVSLRQRSISYLQEGLKKTQSHFNELFLWDLDDIKNEGLKEMGLA